MIAMLKTEKIEKDAQHFAEELWISSVIAKAENDISPVLEDRVVAPADELLASFIKEAEKFPCYELIRQVEQRSWIPKIRVRNSFRYMAHASGKPGDRFPLIGVRKKDQHLIPEDEKDRSTGEAPAKTGAEGTKRVLEHTGELSESVKRVASVRNAIASLNMPPAFKASAQNELNTWHEPALMTATVIFRVLTDMWKRKK